ncbi:MAG: hypothetical protein OSB74_12000, partial [Verrucomicrobiota bacterium]|nr:hypothetical protein [Verrucomicrobiota bacterium]
QRLEFLGDAVLQLVLTVDLFKRFPDYSEGSMTKLRSRLVSRDALQEYSRDIKMGKYLLVGKGEDASGGRERASTLADAFESLVGAVYLDSGFGAARKFVLLCASSKIEKLAAWPIEQKIRLRKNKPLRFIGRKLIIQVRFRLVPLEVWVNKKQRAIALRSNASHAGLAQPLVLAAV